MRAFQREAEVTAGGAKFLVVEDDGAVARTIERVLQRHLPVVHAEGCREALRALDESVVGVVVDIGLPDGNGLDLASAAVGRYPPPSNCRANR